MIKREKDNPISSSQLIMVEKYFRDVEKKIREYSGEICILEIPHCFNKTICDLRKEIIDELGTRTVNSLLRNNK